MDNPNEVPVGTAGATAALGQTDATTHPTAGTEGSSATIPATAEGSNTATPAWAGDQRFAGKTPDDVYKSYRELETKLGDYKSIQEKAQLADLLQERLGITPDKVQDYIAQQEAEAEAARQKQMTENPGQFAIERVQAIEAELAMEKEKASLNSFVTAHPELEPIKQQLFKIAMTAEAQSNMPYEQIYENYFGGAMKIAGEQAYQKIGEKQQMSTTAPSSADVQRPNLDDLSVADLEKILPHAN